MARRRVVTTAPWLRVCGTAIGLILAFESAASGGGLGQLTLQDKPLEVLGGRVLVRMPEGAKVEPRKAANIMGADPSADEEGRIVLDSGSERFVVMAQETFQWAGKDFKEAIGRQYAHCTIAPMQPGKETPESYLLVPKEVKPGREATGVAFACIVLPDKTVVRLGAYVNPAACQDIPGCTELARQILCHATGGNVPLRREAGTRRLRAMITGKDLQIDLPADHVVTGRRGPDFFVYYIRPISPLGVVPPTLVLYQGAHPSAFHKKGETDGAKPPETTSADGTFLGQKTSWVKWSSGTGDQARTHAEAIVAVSDNWKFHVYFWGRTPEEMAQCEKIAQGMALVDKQADAATTPAPAAGAAAPI